MDIAAELDAMRAAIQGCSLAAYTDLSSQLVLCSSAVSTPRQEDINALSAAAELALNGAFAESASPVWGGTAPADIAMLMSSNDVRVFLRSASNPSEALICVCGTDTDLTTAADQARAALARISAAG